VQSSGMWNETTWYPQTKSRSQQKFQGAFHLHCIEISNTHQFWRTQIDFVPFLPHNHYQSVRAWLWKRLYSKDKFQSPC